MPPGMMRLVTFAAVLTFAVGSNVQAQDGARETVTRVHQEGGYPDDITVLLPESGSGEDMSGHGRGPGRRTSGTEERTADPGADGAPLPWLRDLISWLENALQFAAQPLGWVLLAVLGAVLLFIFVFLIARLRVAARIDSHESRETVSVGPLDPLLSRSDLRAEELAAAGRFREAIHALFLDALTNAGGLEGAHRGRTARELVGMLPAARTGHTELSRLLDLTELVWFGGRPATELQYHDARALREAVTASGRGELT